jgi:chorismate mutase-like protein
VSACGSAETVFGTGGIAGTKALGPLAVLAAKRLVLGVDVAAAKFASGRPIDDPAREQEILAWAERKLNSAETRPGIGIQFFRDQISANKAIQRGLHTLWRKRPGFIPVSWRDLTTEVRPQLDVINRHMLLLLMSAPTVPPARCGLPEHLDLFEVFDATLRVHPPLDQFGSLRQEAADVALRSLY